MKFFQAVMVNTSTAFCYFLCGYLGGMLALPPVNSSPIWPAAGFALAIIKVCGNKIIPGLFLGALLTHAINNFDAPLIEIIKQKWLFISIKAFASCLQAYIAIKLIDIAIGKDNKLQDFSAILLFFLLGAIVACTISPTIYLTFIYYQNVINYENFLTSWFTWWCGDVTGVIIITPVVLSFIDKPKELWRPRVVSVAVPLTILLLIMFAIYSYANDKENENRQADFTTRANKLHNNLQNSLEEYQYIADYLATYFNSAELLNSHSFSLITDSSLIHHPEFLAISLLQKSTKNPLTTEIVFFELQKKLQASNELSEQIKNSLLDHGLLSAQDETLLSGKVIEALVSDQSTEKTILITSAISENKLNAEKKYIAIFVRLKKLKQLINEKARHLNLLFEIRNKHSIFFSNNINTPLLPAEFFKLRKSYSILNSQQNWQVIYLPSPDFVRMYDTWHLWWLATGGLFFTGLANISLLGLCGKSEHIEERVKLKTKDLNFFNQQLKQEVRHRHQLQTELAFKNSILHRLAKGEKLTIILDEIVAGTEQQITQCYCAVLLLSENRKRLIHGSSISLPEYFVKTLTSIKLGQNLYSFDTAAYTSKRVIVDDIFNAASPALFTKQAKSLGIIASWSEPIFSSKGTQIGTFNIFFKQTTLASSWKLETLQNMAELSAVAIDYKRTEEELRIAAITFQSHDAVMITDSKGIILRVNHAFTDISGYLPEEVIGKHTYLFNSGKHKHHFFTGLYKKLIRQGRWEGEIWNRHKNGNTVPERFSITAVYSRSEITHFVIIFSDISDKKANEEEIQKLAFYDPLTSLPNRRLLLDRLEQAIINTKRRNIMAALIYLDIDRFKSINDSMGHKTGDELLKIVALRILHIIRKEDTACRLGGDEFVVLLSGFDMTYEAVVDQIALIAEKIRTEINIPIKLAGKSLHCSTSIGVTMFPEQSQSPEEILEQADTAMYRSKQHGRNMVSFFNPKMQEEHDKRTYIEQQLKKAIKEKQFVLYYQAQFDDRNQITSAEALLRWNHPENGLVSLSEFIPIAEESHLILEIGEWVINQACRQIKSWQSNGIQFKHIAINISPRQFRQNDFIMQLRKAIAKNNILASTLMIELTEGILVEDVDDTIEKMQQLQSMGIAIAIDDFGTGYSSLAYLKKMPLSVLKIDRSFVADINEDYSDEVIVEAIIALAQKLNLEVIAEGVEDFQQRQFLIKKGCYNFQGFYFDRPVLAETLALKYIEQQSIKKPQ